MRILVFDTETSGLNPQWNVILQLSYQIVDSNTWATQKTANHYFSWPENKARVTREAIIVNGLTEEVLASKQLSDRKTALEDFVKDKDSCDLLVAHNLEFDKKFIIASCREEGVKFANSDWAKSYDTMKRMTSYCQIPKDWGNGYKWPKLTELADCLGIDYSQISLHDSSGDVELTKLCFEGIVAEGLYNLYDIADIPRNIILRVESPDDIRIETEDGELVDEKFFKDYFGLSKKTFNVARQELIMQWSEEKEEERNDLIYLYRKSTKLKTEEDFKAEIVSIKPNQYVRKAFDEQTPSKEKIQEKLETEAEHEVSSWMFWSLKKKRQEYVEERLEPYYQEQVEAYNQRRAQHEEFENKAEEEYNLQSQQRCEERKQRLAALIEGSNADLLKEEMLRVPDVMSLSFPYHVEATLNGTAITISLSLPQPKDLPNMEGVRLASGNYKIKEIPDKNKKKDYSEWVLGIAIYVVSYYFNVSPKINSVNVEGHVSMEGSNDISLYEMSFDRTTYSSLNFEDMDIDAALSNFAVTNKLKKDVLTELFAIKDEEPKQEKKATPCFMHDSLFADVARLIVKNQDGSAANIQRAFGIGYNRAGNIVEQLEKAGIVGPLMGSKPREVLIGDEQALEDILAGL
jgi:DNA segregation ATPase FtsK/SpoIIIE-like protein